MQHLFKLTLALMAVMSTMSLAQEAKTGTKLKVRETLFNYGYIPPESKVSHSFYLLDTGKDSLKVLSVKPGCGCTKAPLKRDVVGPGDSAEVELIFSASHGYSGEVTKTTTVSTDDSDLASFQLLFKSRINEKPDSVAPLQLSLWSITFDPATKAKKMDIKIKNVSNTAVKPQLVSAPLGYLNIALPKQEIAAGKEADLFVSIDPSCKDAEFTKSFTITAGDASDTRFTIPVSLVNPAATQLSKPTGRIPIQIPTGSK